MQFFPRENWKFGGHRRLQSSQQIAGKKASALSDYRILALGRGAAEDESVARLRRPVCDIGARWRYRCAVDRVGRVILTRVNNEKLVAEWQAAKEGLRPVLR
jgi:hypothetical protein